MQPLVNDFFCGCGGMGVGFMSAGYKIAGAWDFDKYAVQSYRHNVGDHVKQADIREMKWSDVPFAHVWVPLSRSQRRRKAGRAPFEMPKLQP